jgi:hypothetical protein
MSSGAVSFRGEDGKSGLFTEAAANKISHCWEGGGVRGLATAEIWALDRQVNETATPNMTSSQPIVVKRK